MSAGRLFGCAKAAVQRRERDRRELRLNFILYYEKADDHLDDETWQWGLVCS